MNSSEYANLEQVESKHWYYAGKRELVLRWLRRVKRDAPGTRLLDCGAGTGRFAEEMRTCGLDVFVLDDHEESLAMLRRKFPAERVLALEREGIPLPASSVDVVTALDVLEHIGPDADALKGMWRVLKPGGVLIATVPAGMELWSDWDVALQHHRRYDRCSLAALFNDQDWELLYLNYTNVAVYPLVWAVRFWQRWRKPVSRAEDRVPPAPINALLRRVFVWTGLWRLPWPRGVSLIVLAVRR